jgi:hypothetical protein
MSTAWRLLGSWGFRWRGCASTAASSYAGGDGGDGLRGHEGKGTGACLINCSCCTLKVSVAFRKPTSVARNMTELCWPPESPQISRTVYTCIHSLIMDKELGNLIKVDRFG